MTGERKQNRGATQEGAFAEGYAAAADALKRPHRQMLEVFDEFMTALATWIDANPDAEATPAVIDSYNRLHRRAKAAHDEFEHARFDWEAALARRREWGRIERAAEAAEGREP